MANTVNAINNSLYQNLNFNFIADFAPIANEVLRRARQLNRVHYDYLRDALRRR